MSVAATATGRRPLGAAGLLALGLLVLQLLAVYALRHREHGWRPAWMPDSKSYVEAAAAAGFEQALSHYRTYGYPLFLRLVAGGGSRVDHLPTLQFALYGVAVLLLWLALAAYTGSAWLAFAATTPLPWAHVVDLMPEIMTDPLATSLTLAVAAAVLALAVRPADRLLWIALALAVLATYQVRPAAVFLVAWAPLAAGVARLCREGRPPARLGRWAAGLALATLLPLLAFAGLRWQTVGHFGLVSYGDSNLAGVAANFLDEELLEELPEEHRRMAFGMLRSRNRRGWQPMTPGADTRQWFLQYSENIWKVAIPAGEAQLRRERRRLAATGAPAPDRRPGRVRRNELLGELSRAILRARPRLYLQWVRDAFLYGLAALAGRPWIVWPALLLGVSLAALAVRRRAAVRWATDPRARALAAFAFLALSYFLVYLFLLSLVSWPFPRYFAAMALFLPGALVMTLLESWRRLAGRGPDPAQSR